MKTNKSNIFLSLKSKFAGLLLATLIIVICIQSLMVHTRQNFGNQISPSCCGPKCRVKVNRPGKHYEQAYFNWQTKLGRKKAKEKNWGDFLGATSTDCVADLGAGGAHILASLNVRKRIAVEINDAARQSMQELYPGKIESYEYPEDVPNNSVDILFSTSALEHFECPLTELREMSKKVKRGGRVIVGILNEGLAIGLPPVKHDRHQHIYTWNFQNLQNLLNFAGFEVTGFEPNISKSLEHASKITYPHSFVSHAANLYIWVRGVKL